MAVIALDLGGTKLAGAVFSSHGRPLAKCVVALEGRQGCEVGKLIGQQAVQLLRRARAKRIQVSAIGVSVPGISHSKTGKVWAPNIPGWEDYPLRRELETELRDRRIRIRMDSDRACYILGEMWQGAARGCRNAIFLAVGTGIGAGILSDGRVLRGAHDIGGAIGWLALDRPFRREYVPCGCFEHHASGEGLARVAKELVGKSGRRKAENGKRETDGGGRRTESGRLQAADDWTARDVFAAYERGDGIGKEVLAQAIEFWGMAVANLVSMLNPEKIIFGGGVFGPGRRFLGDIYAEAKRWAQPIAIEQVKLQASKLGGDAGLYGAGYLALQTSAG